MARKRDSKGRFVAKSKPRRRNLDGFMSGGEFHPIRGSSGYSYRDAHEKEPHSERKHKSRGLSKLRARQRAARG